MKLVYVGLALAWVTPAIAQDADLRELCADRPGIGTPPCTVNKGHLQIETGIGDWTLEKDASERTDTILLGDTQLRYGVTDTIEARVGWTPYGHVRDRDRLTGATDREDGIGDVTLGMKANLLDPDGKSLSLAVLPYISLPVGGHAIGAGTWAAGLLVPLSHSLTDAVMLTATPEIDAAADSDRHGRHLSYGSSAGVSVDATKALTLTAELAAYRDDDPGDHATQTLAGFSGALKLGENWQLDFGTNIGLNRATPDAEVYGGIVRRF